MKTLFAFLLLVSTALADPRPDVLLTDGSMLYNVRFVCRTVPKNSVYLVHSRGVCNMDAAEFYPGALEAVPVVDTTPPPTRPENMATAAVEDVVASPAPATAPAPGMVWVRPYTRADGTAVKGYWRHAPGKK